MTAITLTEADRIELPAPQYAGRAVYFTLQNTKVWRANTLDGYGWPFAYERDTNGYAYLLPEIKIAEPEKPPGMVRIRVGYKTNKPDTWALGVSGGLVEAIGFHWRGGVDLKDVTIIDNPHNDPVLEKAIRAAQEGKQDATGTP